MADSTPRPKTKKELDQLFRAQMDDRTWKKIIDQLKNRASNGEMRAIEMLLDRILGKPQQSMDLNVEQKPTVADLPALKRELARLVKDDPELMSEVKGQLSERSLVEQDGSEAGSNGRS